MVLIPYSSLPPRSIMAPKFAIILSLLLCSILGISGVAGLYPACPDYPGRGGDVQHELLQHKDGTYTSDTGYRAQIWGAFNDQYQVLLTVGKSQLYKNGISLAGKSIMNMFVEGKNTQGHRKFRYAITQDTTCLATIPVETFTNVWYEDVV
jgi:hypothetical protein